MTREFAKGLQALEEIFAFLGEFADQHGLGEEVELDIDLVVEELFTNTVKYGSGANDRVLISIDMVGQQLRLELVDFDVEPFDPLGFEPVGLGAPIGERKAGGLGLHLVRSLVDEVAYEYHDREMRVLVTKHLES